MEYSIQSLARMAGISTRTLRYYHKIGLLLPSRTAQNGYRLYGPAQVDALQHILYYRALGMPLAQIRNIVQNPAFDAAHAMQQHLNTLLVRRAELDKLIHTAQQTLLCQKGGTPMQDTEKFEGFKRELIEQNEQQHGAEVRQKYGETAAEAANMRLMQMTEKQHTTFKQTEEELNTTLRAAVQEGDATGETACRAAELHKQWLTFTLPQYTADTHRALVDMYTADERFAAYYEKIVPGGAAFLRQAVYAYLGIEMP